MIRALSFRLVNPGIFYHCSIPFLIILNKHKSYMNLISWDQNVYRPLAGSHTVFGAVSEMKAVAR